MDHRRFWVDQTCVSLVGTFKFDFDPVSLRILDPHRLYHSKKTKEVFYEFWDESTSILVPIDLAQYEPCELCYDGAGLGTEGKTRGIGQLHQVAFTISDLVQCHRFREGRPLSFIFIMMNRGGLHEKLQRIPFSGVYSDYRGHDDEYEDVLQYVINKLCAACDTSNDPGREPVEMYHYVGQPWEDSTVGFILAALKSAKTNQDLVRHGIMRTGKV